jgi:hypothetical protein
MTRRVAGASAAVARRFDWPGAANPASWLARARHVECNLYVGMRLHWLPFALAGACTTSDKPPGHWTPGKGDGVYDLIEAGPAPVGDRVVATLDHRVPAYRVESFGGTTLTIDLSGEDADPYLVVEGPLEGDGDAVAVGAGPVVGEDDDSGPGNAAHLGLMLDRAGVYRILAGTSASLGHGGPATGSVTLAVTCGASCYRAMIDQKTFVREVQASPSFVDYAKMEINQLVPDPDAAARLAAQLDQILGDADLTGIDRFPTIPLSSIALIRPALGAIPSTTPSPDMVITGELSQLLGPCTPDRSLPSDLFPGVKYGQFPSKTLSPCQFAHAGKLAQILTSLAAQNGSSITYGGQTLSSPRELFAALLATGHTIEVRNERMYANFLSMIVDGERDLIWPVWLDTGIALSSGDSFDLPVGHSGHAWRISGPIVDTRVMFFLGISGAGFFGQTDQRPAWAGAMASTDEVATGPTSGDYADALESVDVSAAYLRRNRVERSTVASGLPADGYGYVGVCNDSNAVIEYMTKGTITTFPLLRAKALDAQPDLGDGLDDVMRMLPKDGDGLPDPRDALRRAVAMQPFPDGSPLMWDAVLGAQIATARHDVGL